MNEDAGTDRPLERHIARLLAWGVLLAAGVGLLGTVFYLREHRGVRADLSVFTPEPQHLREPLEVARGAAAMDGAALLQLCVLLLVLTPVSRVVLSLAVFARRRDWVYAGVAGVVIAALAIGLVQ